MGQRRLMTLGEFFRGEYWVENFSRTNQSPKANKPGI
jgi:hypothetical protein